jgi:flagellar motor switch protein FliN/FliY
MKLNAIRDTAASADADATGRTAVLDDIAMISHVRVDLSAQIGTTSLTVEKLFGLKAGDVIAMNESLDAPVTILLNGRAVAQGELLAIEDHYGIRILELA